MGSKRIWGTIRAFNTHNLAKSTQISNDLLSQEYLQLQDELIRPDIPHPNIPFAPDNDSDNIMNREFSLQDLQRALSSCVKDTSLGMDFISYKMIKKLSIQGLSLLLKICNKMFKFSQFPAEWCQTRVLFLPTPGGKGFKPISLTSALCKLLERLVHYRFEYLVKYIRWLPASQYGCRKTRSSMDCVAAVSTDILQAFNNNNLVLALSIDIKGAFNSVQPQILLQQLTELGVFSRIWNFINFFISSRHLYFSQDQHNPNVVGIGVLQGEVLSPLLFNLYLRDIQRNLGPNVKTGIYVDDVFIYTECLSYQEGLNTLQESMSTLTPWLETIGMSISVPKSQWCYFSKNSYNRGFLMISTISSKLSVLVLCYV